MEQALSVIQRQRLDIDFAELVQMAPLKEPIKTSDLENVDFSISVAVVFEKYALSDEIQQYRLF